MFAYIVAGIGFGDEGKGATVQYLCANHSATLVIRYNGGSQAGHNVIRFNSATNSEEHHMFSQFGSGSFTEGVRTLLSKYMLVNPGNMLNEAEALES